MVEAAERNDRVLDVSFNHRRRGEVKALKKLIDAGLLGQIYYAKAGWLRREGIPGLGSWFTRRATAGGGPLMDIGVHMLDMALYLLGEPAGAHGDRGDVRGVRAARSRRLGGRDHAEDRGGRGRVRRRGPVHGVPPARPAAAPCCWSRAGRSGCPRTSATSPCTAPTAAPASIGCRPAAAGPGAGDLDREGRRPATPAAGHPAGRASIASRSRTSSRRCGPAGRRTAGTLLDPARGRRRLLRLGRGGPGGRPARLTTTSSHLSQ